MRQITDADRKLIIVILDFILTSERIALGLGQKSCQAIKELKQRLS